MVVLMQVTTNKITINGYNHCSIYYNKSIDMPMGARF